MIKQINSQDINYMYSNQNCFICDKYFWSGYIINEHVIYFDYVRKWHHLISCYECKDKCGCNSIHFLNVCNCEETGCDIHDDLKIFGEKCNKCYRDPIFFHILKKELYKKHNKILNSKNKRLIHKYKHGAIYKTIKKFAD